MRSVIINSSDVSGGAAMAGFAIFEALNNYSDVDTYILCGSKYSHHSKVDEIMFGSHSASKKLFDRIKGKVVSLSIGLNYWHPSSRYFLKHPFLKNADIINLHNIHVNYFAYPVIRKLAKIAPVVVTMQDMWYLTGHCAYTKDCEGFKAGCSTCPHLDWYPAIKHDTAAFHARKKKEIFEELDLHFISCSKWLIGEAKESFILKGRKFHHIYNPIDTGALSPIDGVEKSIIRKLFNVPGDKNVVCFGAVDIGDERKGFELLMDSLDEKYIRKNNIFFAIMGDDRKGQVNKIPSYIPYKYFGNTKTDIRNYIYNLSDILVLPSLEDDLPNMLLESLSSGLPVIASDVGGCGEVIKTNHNGYLARRNDMNDFKAGISAVLEDRTHKQFLSENARNFALKNFSPEVCAEKYSSLFKEIIGNRHEYSIQ